MSETIKAFEACRNSLERKEYVEGLLSIIDKLREEIAELRGRFKVYAMDDLRTLDENAESLRALEAAKQRSKYLEEEYHEIEHENYLLRKGIYIMRSNCATAVAKCKESSQIADEALGLDRERVK